MAYTFDKKTGEITIAGWEKGIGASPHDGLGDLKNVNISTEKGEASVNFSRVRQDQAAVAGGAMSNNGVTTTFVYAGTLTAGTWILINSHTGSPGTTDGHYYWTVPVVVGVSYNLYSDFGVTQITSGGTGTINFDTLAMAAPIDYCVEQHSVSAGNSYRYFILDAAGVIWVSGTSSTPAAAGALSSTTAWSAITPHSNTPGGVDTFNNNQGSIQIMYATDTNNKISANYMMVFTGSQILYGKNSDNSGWPSITGSPFTAWKTLGYSGGYSHKSILGLDQVIYFCDGPGIGVFYQVAGQQFDPNSSGTYSYVDAQYVMAPTDASTRITQIPTGNSIAVVVGGLENNLYIYPDVQSSSSSKPINILWLPEANVQYFVQANGFVFIFCGNKGNIYLTNGSTVVPVGTVPDYVAGSVNFTQEPYFIWGGAMYLRGRLFFSLKDQTASHTGNCGGVWSFVPTFNYFPQQDSGLSLRLENASSQYATHGYNGYATLLFAGQESTAQQGNGPQYIGCWAQTTSSTTTNSIDFSGTVPYTGGQALIETDAIPVGTFLDKKTFEQIEYKLAAVPAAGDSVAINYRTSLEAVFATCGTVETESGTLSGYLPVNFQKAQFIQLQIILTAASSNSSFVRLKQVYIR